MLYAKSLLLCTTLCNPIDCSLPGSSVHGILQVRILDWVAIPFPGNLPDPGIEPGSLTLQADCSQSEPPGLAHNERYNSPEEIMMLFVKREMDSR